MTPEQARLGALKRFAISITFLTAVGHAVLGFEVSLLQLVVCAFTAYALELLLEAIGAWSENRRPAFIGGGFKKVVVFLLPAHITAFALAMLLYSPDRLLPAAFASAIAITSKSIFTVTVDGRRRHFLNPSNLGLLATIFLFPSIAFAPTWEFTQGVSDFWKWMLPVLFILLGTFINARFTKKLPLITAWLVAFVLQAVIRHLFFPTSLAASLAPMTGVAFLLFTYYMITDPQTSPSSTRGQIVFGISLGVTYGVLISLHVVFTIFVALFVVCVGRGAFLYLSQRVPVRQLQDLTLAWFGRASARTSTAAVGAQPDAVPMQTLDR
jgi:enediyne biosynthesis protein E5